MTPEVKELEKELFYALEAEFLAIAFYESVAELSKNYRRIGEVLQENEHPEEYAGGVWDAIEQLENQLEEEYDAAHPEPPPEKCPQCGK